MWSKSCKVKIVPPLFTLIYWLFVTEFLRRSFGLLLKSMGNWQLLSRKLFGSEKNEECNNRKKPQKKIWKFEIRKKLIHAWNSKSINKYFFLQVDMATKVGSMQAKSKSETSQNRPKRQAKYSSMKTLRRQEAKLDVTVTDNFESENEENIENLSSHNISTSSANVSFKRFSSKILNKLFPTPQTPGDNSHRKTTLSRKRSFVM